MKKKFIVILLLAIIYFTGSTLIDAGTFKVVESKFDGKVLRIYNNMAGPEDLDVDEENGLIFISSSDRRLIKEGKESPNDGIYLLPLDVAAEPSKLPTTLEGPFHPHGISFFKKEDKSYLLAVNHTQKGDFVEAFQFENQQLKHLATYEDPMMCCPNDLVAVDKDKFYVTNDHGNKEGAWRVLEDYLKIPSSYLLYHDGHMFSKAYEELNYANGVDVSNDGRKLYLTHTTGRELLTFDRNPESGFLEIRNTLKLGTGVDNINVDKDGNIWVAAHPKLFSFVEHANNAKKKSPSQIIKITPHGQDAFGVDEIYTNNGEEISGSSAVVSYNGQIFVGTVFENKLLHANLN